MTLLRRLLCLSLWLVAALMPAAVAAVDASELLEPEKAFRFSAKGVDARTVEITWRIADGYYLYKEKIRLSASPAGVTLGAPAMPQGLPHEDAFFGRSEVYRKEVRIRVPVEGAVERFKLVALSQGCADVGVCYVPQEQTADIRLAAMSTGREPPPLLSRLGVGSSEELTDRPAAVAPSASSGAAFRSDEDHFLGVLESGSLWAVLGFFFVAGLALTFTPCVLPMVPILSGIIVGERGRHSKRHALVLSITYVLGMVVTYTAIGIGAALSGQFLSAALQNAWVLGAFALVFVALALSSFGLYELRMPSFLHAHAMKASQRLPGGRIGGVALMGVLSAAIVSPCVAAPLAGALLYISQSRDVWLGGTALFAMSLGMGVPLIAVGISEGALLPRSGAWMHAVRRFFGVLLLGVALWIVSPVIPALAVMLGWAALLIGSGVFLRALDSLPPQASGWMRLGKGFGVMVLIAGAALVVGALSGSRDPLTPLSGLLSGNAAPATGVRFERIASVADLDRRLGEAKRPVMLDFYADWCVSCKEMERFTFSDARVQSRLADFVLLQADVTAGSADDRELLKRFRLFGPPGIVFFDGRGAETPVRVIGYQKPDAFLRSLDAATASSQAVSRAR